MTRNNDVGVYICCTECDYIYLHQNCGWPNEQIDCPICGEKIGAGISSHTLSRNDKGARRLMTKIFTDIGRPYYVDKMAALA